MAGDVRFHQDEFAAAVPYFERALQLDPDYELIRDHLLFAIPHLPAPGAAPGLAAAGGLPRPPGAGRGTAPPDHRQCVPGRGLRAGCGGDVPEGRCARWGVLAAARIRGVPHPARSGGGDGDGAAGDHRFPSRSTPWQTRKKLRSLKTALVHAVRFQGRLAEVRVLLAGRALGRAEAPGSHAPPRRLHGRFPGGDASRRLSRGGGRRGRGCPVPPGRSALLSRDGASFPRRRAFAPRFTVTRSSATSWRSSDSSWTWPTRGRTATWMARRRLPARPSQSRRRPARASSATSSWASSSSPRGDCAGAIASLETWREQRMPGGSVEELTQILPLLAGCYEKLGDLPSARARVDELLGLWPRADPGLPRLIQARAIQARLAAAGAPGK